MLPPWGLISILLILAGASLDAHARWTIRDERRVDDRGPRKNASIPDRVRSRPRRSGDAAGSAPRILPRKREHPPIGLSSLAPAAHGAIPPAHAGPLPSVGSKRRWRGRAPARILLAMYLALASSAHASAPDRGVIEADLALQEIGATLQFSSYRQPVNANQARSVFLADPSVPPVLTYNALDPGRLASIGAKLDAFTPPKGQWGRLLDARRDRMKRILDWVNSRGDRKRAIEASIALYGEPSDSLVSAAKQILQEVPPGEKPPKLPDAYGKLVERFDRGLEDYGLHDWRVVRRPGRAITISPSRQTIAISDDEGGRRVSIEGSFAHEFLGHLFRTLNGARQPLSVFAAGLAGGERSAESLARAAEPADRDGYLDTEEGLAAVLQIAETGNWRLLRRYAARTLAAAAAADGRDFTEVFAMLRGYGLSEKAAWSYTYRQFRGGGLVRDHIYLQGLLRVLAYLERGGDPVVLFAGKIDVRDARWVAPLLADGVLAQPEYVPSILRQLPEDNPVLTYARRLALRVYPDSSRREHGVAE
jgi:hypothetical protein